MTWWFLNGTTTGTGFLSVSYSWFVPLVLADAEFHSHRRTFCSTQSWELDSWDVFPATPAKDCCTPEIKKRRHGWSGHRSMDLGELEQHQNNNAMMRSGAVAGLQLLEFWWIGYLDIPGHTWTYLDIPGHNWTYLDLGWAFSKWHATKRIVFHTGATGLLAFRNPDLFVGMVALDLHFLSKTF